MWQLKLIKTRYFPLVPSVVLRSCSVVERNRGILQAQNSYPQHPSTALRFARDEREKIRDEREKITINEHNKWQMKPLFLLLGLQLALHTGCLNAAEFFSTLPHPTAPIQWSILITTLASRRASFDYIFNKLQQQITAAHLTDQIEIIVYRDQREQPVGYKRNRLLAAAQGAYVNFCDDDDDIADDYVQTIYHNLQTHQPDCVSFEGIVTFAGTNPMKFIHATKYKSYELIEQVYYRPPTHLDVIKTSIAQQFKFSDEKNWQEDREWALKISAADVLKHEIHIDSHPLYFYQFDPLKSETFNQYDFAAANRVRQLQTAQLAKLKATGTSTVTKSMPLPASPLGLCRIGDSGSDFALAELRRMPAGLPSEAPRYADAAASAVYHAEPGEQSTPTAKSGQAGDSELKVTTSSSTTPAKILFKFPTRQRAAKVCPLLDRYYAKLSHQLPFEFVLSCDEDDSSMNNAKMRAKLQKYAHLTVHFGPRVSKIEAVNRDIDQHLDFDILVIISDDMTPVAQNYDLTIANLMQEKFPDYDGVLHFFDGHVGAELNTLPIIGRKYYQRFNYVYYPEYLSICCDLEYTLVAQLLGKLYYSDQLLIRHDHGGYTGKKDALFWHNESKSFWAHDKQILQSRKAQNFQLAPTDIKLTSLPTSLDLFGKTPAQVTWSILIPTIKRRQEQFTQLYLELLRQIQKNKLEQKVEVIFDLDDQTMTVGEKRNRLLQASRGTYISYIDDDDEVAPDFVSQIYQKLMTSPDCVNLVGILRTPGQPEQRFEHSLKYSTGYTDPQTNQICSPIYHLNPIKRAIAMQFQFPHQNFNEDTSWAAALHQAGLLKQEAVITQPLYFYNYDPQKSQAKPKVAQANPEIRWNPHGMLVVSHLKPRVAHVTNH